MRRAAYSAVLVWVLAAAAACGQKGPLYLPDEGADNRDRQEQAG